MVADAAGSSELPFGELPGRPGVPLPPGPEFAAEAVDFDGGPCPGPVPWVFASGLVSVDGVLSDCPTPSGPCALEALVSFTGGSETSESLARRSERDMICTGVGCRVDCDVVTGGIWTGMFAWVATGDVVLGCTMFLGEGWKLDATLTSARFISWLGDSTEGFTSALVGFWGCGGVIFLTCTLFGDQMTTWGRGIS